MSNENQAEPAATEGRLTVITQPPIELFRQATDVASVCKQIVTKTAVRIRDKNHVKVEGWEAIAAAHGCHAGAGDAKREYDAQGNHIGYTAKGYVRNSNGVIIATGDGFVGFDETDRSGKHTWKERAEYAGRAMAQTRAISRACRSVFAHVVVLIDANLSTTPAEEVPHDDEPHDRAGRRTPLKTEAPTREKDIEALRKFMAEYKIPEGFVMQLCVQGNLADGTEEFITDLKDGVIKRLCSPKMAEAIIDRWKKKHGATPTPTDTPGSVDAPSSAFTPDPPKRPLKIGGHGMTPENVMHVAQVEKWQDVIVPSGSNKDIPLGDLTPQQLQYYISRWKPALPVEGVGYDEVDITFDAALTLAAEEVK